MKGKINNKQKIIYGTLRQISTHKLKQMVNSYIDWCEKNNYSFVNMNMYQKVKRKIKLVCLAYKVRIGLMQER